METVHLVTGATGFLGSALVLELMRRTADPVVCLARPAEDACVARQRVRQALDRAARASLQDDLLESVQQRCRVVAGDLLLPGCGVAPERVGPVSRVWHVAATLRFEPELRDGILQHNVQGTQHVLALARRLRAERFNYVSTAYVAGARRGLALERLVAPDSPVNNAYERSKVLAEHEVASGPLPFRIFRPSIVIGYSKTGSPAGSDSGFYGYIRRLVSLRRVAQRQGRLAELSALYLPGDPAAELNLIPVDAVVQNAIAIDGSDSSETIFHLTNGKAPAIGYVAEAINAKLGIAGPRFRIGERAEGPYGPQIEKHMRFFLSYLVGGKSFDQSHTHAAIGAQASLWPLESEGLLRYVERYLEEEARL